MLLRGTFAAIVTLNIVAAGTAAILGSASGAVALLVFAGLLVMADRFGRAEISLRTHLVRQLWAARVAALVFAALGVASTVGPLERNALRIVLSFVGLVVALHWIRSLRRDIG